MYIYEIKDAIDRLISYKENLEKIIEGIKANNKTVPIGLPKEMFGNDNPDRKYVTGVYNDMFVGAKFGEYFPTEDTYTYSEQEIQKLEISLANTNKELEKLNKELEKLQIKEKKEPAKIAKEISSSKLGEIDSDKLTREDMEAMLVEIEKNHKYIQDNTQLIEQSDSLIGRIKRFLGNKNILGFGDIQRKAEELKLAIERENDFVKARGGAYEKALNSFKYGNPQGPVTVKLYDYGEIHGEYTMTVGEVTLEAFDHIFDEVGKRIYKKGTIRKEEYDQLVKEYSKPEETEFEQDLKDKVVPPDEFQYVESDKKDVPSIEENELEEI